MTALFSQPIDGAFGDQLAGALQSGGFSEFAFLVAYARLSGVARMAEHLEAFHATGGTTVGVVGIDQINTSLEALQLLSAIGVSLWVYHDENDYRTFHPKVFSLKGAGARWLAIGSSNFTAGGFYTNDEANVIITPNLGRNLEKSIDALFTTYTDPNTGHARRADHALLALLEAESYLLSEAAIQAARRVRIPVVNRAAEPIQGPVFPRSRAVRPLPTIPARFQSAAAQPIPIGAAAATVATPSSSAFAAAAVAATPTSSSVAVVVTGATQPVSAAALGAGFWKRLSSWDTNPNSSPGQIQIPIRFLSLFPALTGKKTMPSGAVQSDALFDVEFLDGVSAPLLVRGARAILYEPAPTHPRPNKELRFTFRNRAIAGVLKAGDVLAFRQTGRSSPYFEIELLSGSNAKGFNGKFDSI